VLRQRRICAALPQFFMKMLSLTEIAVPDKCDKKKTM
jgi:hypothetical protein